MAARARAKRSIMREEAEDEDIRRETHAKLITAGVPAECMDMLIPLTDAKRPRRPTQARRTFRSATDRNHLHGPPMATERTRVNGPLLLEHSGLVLVADLK